MENSNVVNGHWRKKNIPRILSSIFDHPEFCWSKKIIPRVRMFDKCRTRLGYVSRNTLKCRILAVERRESRRGARFPFEKGFIVTDTRHSTPPCLRWNSVVRVYAVSAVILLPFYCRPPYKTGENKPTDRLERLFPPEMGFVSRRRILLSVEPMEFFLFLFPFLLHLVEFLPNNIEQLFYCYLCIIISLIVESMCLIIIVIITCTRSFR